MKMQMRLGSIGVVLAGCAMALSCVRYVYQTPPPSGPTATETEVAPAGGSDQPFYDDLAPYGNWVYVAGPGWVWSPHNVQAGWRPYELGHWVFTDYGWTWASDEQWGWAVYHYGRWHQDASYGWVWVPGTEWGPAWVAWHEGGGYVGWAPLPWQVRFRAGVGLDWAGVSVSIQPSWWCFTTARYLVDPGLRTRIVPPARNVTLIKVTQNVTNYTFVDNRIVNQGVKVEKIGRAVGHTIPRYRVQEDNATEAARGGKVRGEEFVVFRPNPGRGHTSHGRPVRPGRDETRQPRDYRPATGPQTEPPQTEPAQATPPAPPANSPSEPPATTRGQETRDREQESQQNRGRRIFDQLRGRQSPHRSPQEPAPSQPASPSQPPASPDQPSAPASHPSTPAAPPADTQAGGATTPHPKPNQAKGQQARPDLRGRKNADAKGKKGKPEAAKSEASDADKTKKEKPDSEN